MRLNQKTCFAFAAACFFLFALAGNAQPAHSTLTFVKPEKGAKFQAPAPIGLQVIAVDQSGDIRRVEFLANGQRIGVSEHLTKDAVIPGRPREHFLEWKNVAAGEYQLTAKAIDTLGNKVLAPPITIHVLPSVTGETVLLTKTQPWKYWNRREAPPISASGAAWNHAGFNDTDWLSGEGPLGYGDIFIKTKTEGADMENRAVTAYFRAKFEVKDPALVKALTVYLMRDDGAVVYLNGVEVLRDNMPAGSIIHTTLAAGSAGDDQEGNFKPFTLSSAHLKAGINSVAVEVHQVNQSSSDLSFHLAIVSGSETPVETLPTVSLKVIDGEAAESGNLKAIFPGTFVITRTGLTERPLSVLLSYSGTASMGIDYAEVPREVVIKEGSISATIDILPKNDEKVEEVESVIAKILGRDIPTYKIDAERSAGTVRILDAHTVDPDVPTVAIVATQAETAEPSPTSRIIPGRFALTRTGSVERSLVVYVKASGTATPELDYSRIPERVEFPAGSASAEVIVAAVQDTVVEPDESVILAVIAPPGLEGTTPPYRVAPDRAEAKVIIHDTTQISAATIEITAPRSGTIFTDPSMIQINAVAIDPDGYIPRLEFYANEKLIGVSEITFIRAPDPGEPVHHTFEWQNPSHGKYVLVAKGMTAKGAIVTSKPVEISIVGDGPPSSTKVRIFASDEEATEFSPLVDAFNPAVFTIWRDGDLSRDLVIFFSVHGTATNGKDYKELGNSVLIKTGEKAVAVEIVPKSDDEKESIETVVLRLEHSPLLSPLPQYGMDDTNKVASVIIYDREQPKEPQVVLAYPTHGQTIEDADVLLIAHAYHPTEEAGVVVFRDGGTIIGVSEIHLDRFQATGLITHTFVWRKPAPGKHAISASLKLANGQEVKSNIHEVAVPGGNENHPPVVAITHPKDGAVFHLEKGIEIAVAASDSDSFDASGNSISYVELYADSQLLIKTNIAKFVYVWTNAKPGARIIYATATDKSGLAAKSHPVRIMVMALDQLSFVRRSLPSNFIPGKPFTVKLAATPFPGTSAYGFEDQPPRGWAVTEISKEGEFDAVTGRVKFGPYLDGQTREVHYMVTPPAMAAGRYEFGGKSAANAKEYAIAGDRIVQSGGDLIHPADSNKDHRMTLVEVTAYGAAWKEGAPWSQGPNPIPLDYATRAGFLWRRGETYVLDAAIGTPPQSWVPNEVRIAPSAVEKGNSAERTVKHGADGAIEVTVTVKPAISAQAYGLIDYIGYGWNVGDISQEGRFDAEGRAIRWGLFLDNQPRVLTYRLTPASDVVSAIKTSGILSVDGMLIPVFRTDAAPATETSAAISFKDAKATSQGDITFQLNAPKGQVCILEKSTDLIHWVAADPVYLPDGTIMVNEKNNGEKCFYRIRTP